MNHSNRKRMADAIDERTLLKAAKDQIHSDLSGETIILNVKTGVYCGLNAVGTRIWELIQKPVTVIEIKDTLLSEYDVEPEQCDQELKAVLTKMLELFQDGRKKKKSKDPEIIRDDIFKEVGVLQVSEDFQRDSTKPWSTKLRTKCTSQVKDSVGHAA